MMNEIVQKYRDGLNKLDVKRLDKVLAMYKVLRPRNYFRVINDIAKDKKLTNEVKDRLIGIATDIYELMFTEGGYLKEYKGITLGDLVYVDGRKYEVMVTEFLVVDKGVFVVLGSSTAGLVDTVMFELVRKKPRQTKGYELCKAKDKDSLMGNLKVTEITSEIRSFLAMYVENEYDFNPCYQRGLVWSLEQKQEFIGALFDGLAYVKPTFLFNGWSSERKAYEVLDGKQRLHTIIEFVQGKFAVRGKYYADLSAEDTKFFMTVPMKYTLLEYDGGLTKTGKMPIASKVMLFLQLNEYGQRVDEGHLTKIKEDYLD